MLPVCASTAAARLSQPSDRLSVTSALRALTLLPCTVLAEFDAIISAFAIHAPIGSGYSTTADY